MKEKQSSMDQAVNKAKEEQSMSAEEGKQILKSKRFIRKTQL